MAAQNEVYLVASGDLRLSANQKCWPVQSEMEEALRKAFEAQGFKIVRAHKYDETEKHGFISSQRMGIEVFKNIPADAKLVVAEAVWQYSHHVLAGLRDHKGPILCVGNWSPEWPGLVGLLNLTASLTKMQKPYSNLWSKDFTDAFFLKGLKEWLSSGKVTHDVSHVRDLDMSKVPKDALDLGTKLGQELRKNKAIMGIFDEGCMGMYNAIFDDELVNALGIYKERLSQSALLAAMKLVTEDEAKAVLKWLEEKGLKFVWGKDEATELTIPQVIEQCKMYIAAGRIFNDYGCDVIGIQYQQGLKDMTPASDLAEGILNNAERPPIYHQKTKVELYPGKPIVHFNEVDEGAAVDALITNRVWTALNLDPATTLHDVRYGEDYKVDGKDQFVWVFEISGSAPPSHFTGGWKGASSERQPNVYFPLGGGTLKGISKPGEIVWSRVFIMDGVLHADLGRGTVVELPREEVERRWAVTTSQWPIMNVVLHGTSRDQLMARHKANHAQVAYGDSKESADKALYTKAAMFQALGIKVHLSGI
eukprot:TRINITY_DN637_c0_g1_i1.p1 TRINITY_DN637_c0_g1~~TRINITY_DN637_c0_g1_i1.p1  ORF type:complete len:535 (+),score=181.63 TRINITY_DN637_c0_g1_i1:85-1689(+)